MTQKSHPVSPVDTGSQIDSTFLCVASGVHLRKRLSLNPGVGRFRRAEAGYRGRAKGAGVGPHFGYLEVVPARCFATRKKERALVSAPFVRSPKNRSPV